MTQAVRSISELQQWVWAEKYRYTDESGVSKEHTIDDTHARVVKGVYSLDPQKELYAETALQSMKDFIWCPAGRIHAGAGTKKRVTSINCFVSPTIQDSMQTEPGLPGLGIFDALKAGGITQQMGGGIGMNFSTLRPDLALVKRTHSVSTGPLPFMNMWDSMCATVKSSGSRRGAMMGVLAIWHPDIRKFIHSKSEKGVLTNFNISVLVTKDFMKAVKEDLHWDLGFRVPRADGQHVDVYEKDGEPWYVYERTSAVALWDEIIRNTFEYAEPGIIFIDRVNEWNNLWYCETISATNPCGEQPLPPDGACNLGAVNLARLVINPFTSNARVDFVALDKAVRTGVRFLDNVLDITMYPTEAQAEEAHNKRRIGLGITGLGNMLQMLRQRYGSDESIRSIDKVMMALRDSAFSESVRLAAERGPFPLFDREKYLEGTFIKTLPESIRENIAKCGIRNGVLLTIAPTGTTSIYYDNVSSGVEPTVAWSFKRKAREADGSYSEFREISDYGFKLFKEVTGWKEGDTWPDYMVSALQGPLVSVEDHLKVQAACQKYIDSSISKTINCPADMEFESFKEVYNLAYEYGCKGCTTYKPSAVRGSVISVEETDKAEPLPIIDVEPRPEELEGYTYKIRYPGLDQAFYVTINDYVSSDNSRRPFEIFINSKSVKHQEWIVALTRMISAIFRRGGDVTFIIEELKQVFSAQGGAFINRKYVPSLVAHIGSTIEQHFIKIGLIENSGMIIPEGTETSISSTLDNKTTSDEGIVRGEQCPNCEAPTLFKVEGCGKCTSCGYSDCS